MCNLKNSCFWKSFMLLRQKPSMYSWEIGCNGQYFQRIQGKNTTIHKAKKHFNGNEMCLHWNHFVLKQRAVFLRNQEKWMYIFYFFHNGTLVSLDWKIVHSLRGCETIQNKTKTLRKDYWFRFTLKVLFPVYIESDISGLHWVPFPVYFEEPNITQWQP